MDSNEITDGILWLTLRESLELLVSDPASQLASLPARCDKPFELADNASHACKNVEVSERHGLTDSQRDSLISVRQFFDDMSGSHNEHLWTERAVAESAEWRRVRELAKHALRSFGWSSAEADAASKGSEELVPLRSILVELQLSAGEMLAANAARGVTPKGLLLRVIPLIEAVTREETSDLKVATKLELLRYCLLLESVANATNQDLFSREALEESPEWELIRSGATECLSLLT